jgi:hypothetical protein
MDQSISEIYLSVGLSIKRKTFVGKRLESEILMRSKIKSPEIVGLFIFKMVEAAGIEPASENLPTKHLHT